MVWTECIRILGIDPGLASSGWGLVERKGNRVHYVAHGCIETESQQDNSKRLLLIYKEIKLIIEKFAPKAGAIETLFFSKNVKSAMPVAEARGVLSMAMAEAGLPVFEYSPSTIKISVSGVASANKHQVQEMVRLILGLSEVPRPDHSADALAAAICCANTLME